jgi:DNA-binding GntR family transcriptional regulator
MPRGQFIYTIREQIADHIRSDILSGRLVEGEQLREEPLARRFGVSRGPIRDVLLQLTQEGLLASKRNCGARVGAAPDEWTQPLVVDLRRRIEVFALRRALKVLDENAVECLDEEVERLRIACQRADMAAIVRHDMAFHRHILEMTGDENLVAMWLPIVQRMMLHYTRHEDMMENHREHVAILEAIRAGDMKKAVTALKQNIQ